MSAQATERPLRHLFLIDGSGFIFRAFHALPPMTRPDGTPVNAVYGFTTMLMRLVQDTDADHVAVIFDAKRETWRNRIYPAYKAHREEPPEELIPQFALIREATRAFNVAAVEMEGYEADDLIATYARQAAARGAEVTIVSSDKDLMQLVGEGISMLDPIRNRPIGSDEVRERFGVEPDKVVDVQALAGDSTDNVPGVPGIGVKTAAELIGQYGDLDTLLARAGEIKQPKRRQTLIDNAGMARLSRELVRLCDTVPVEVPLEDLAVKEPEHETLVAFLKEQNFRSILARVESRRPAAVAEGAGAPVAPPPAEAEYELVQDAERLAAWIARAGEAGIVAVDTETTSLDAMQARLVGVSLSVEPGRACYVPLGHTGAGQASLDLEGGAGAEGPPRQIPLAKAVALLKPLLEDAGVLKVGQNIKYDMLVLARPANGGIRVAPVDDTMVISYVLEGSQHGHGLDELAALHFGHATIKYKEVVGSGRTRVTFDQVPLAAACRYAAEDADFTGRLHRLLKPRLLAERMLAVYETMDRPLIGVLVDMERAGVAVDAAELRRLSADFAGRIAALERDIYRLAGHEFNIASTRQLGEVLFERLGLAAGRKGKSGALSTGADILEALAAEGHDLPARVLDWRQLAKLKSTYADALVGQINPETGRVHTSYSIAVTSTGRLSSTDPNLQNIPVRTDDGRKIRRAFVAPPGHLLLSADYSQIELRLLAAVARIDALKDVFRRGLDVHAMTASQVFGVPVAGMDPVVRRRAKAINFGIIYGISPFGLARQLGIAQGEARAYIDAYFARFPGIRDYMERTKEEARRNGYVTTPFGRRCYTPGINDKNPARRGFAERAAINAPLQGGAADIIKRAMVRLPEALAGAGLKGRLLLQVHDELVLEVPEREAEETAALVRKVMIDANRHLDVPIEVETGASPNWADAH
ncbi:MAG: DNA polymerase I [Proteobacteria bacterium]|nr:DNA polymerase I [Pseudomonadota bacterium]